MKIFDCKWLRRFAKSETLQAIAAVVFGEIALGASGWIASGIGNGRVSTWDAVWIAVIAGNISYCLFYGYLNYIMKIRNAVIKSEIDNDGAHFYLKDPKLQLKMEDEFEGFGEELQRVCEFDFYNADDVIWLDFDKDGKYYHLKINKTAIVVGFTKTVESNDNNS